MAGEDIVRDSQPEKHSVLRIGDAEHESVTDRLDLRPPKRWKLGCYGVAEIGH